MAYSEPVMVQLRQAKMAKATLQAAAAVVNLHAAKELGGFCVCARADHDLAVMLENLTTTIAECERRLAE